MLLKVVFFDSNYAFFDAQALLSSGTVVELLLEMLMKHYFVY